MTDLIPNDLLDSIQCIDALTLLRGLPDQSVDLIASDPPFNIGKAAWDSWESLDAYLLWLEDHLREFKRVLKPNGSLYLFAATKYQARVELAVGKYFNVLSNIRWRKDEGWHKKADEEIARAYFAASETIIFAEQCGSDSTGLDIILNDMRLFSGLRAYFWGERKRVAHLSYDQINAQLGTATGGGGVASNTLNSYKLDWHFPPEETYALFNNRLGICQRPYAELRREYEELRREYEELRREYEDLRRPFYATADAPYTDVWDFATVNTYPGKHPCEKPIDLCEHIILRSSRPGALVVDPFCGSGNMLRAAWLNDRHYLGCDKDSYWHRRAVDSLRLPFEPRLVKVSNDVSELPLFAYADSQEDQSR